MEIPHDFFLERPLEIPLPLQLTPEISNPFSSIPVEIPCPHPTYLGFSGIAQIPHSISKKKASRIGQIKIPYSFERLAI